MSKGVPEVIKQTVVRDERAGDLLEMMLVIAVVTVLCIRGFLRLTGYPQLGGGGLHIAHMLWGGLGMLAAIVLLLSFWNPAMRQFCAFLAGVGFGFFIDELGKFITSDNDYFFQPTIALMYILFVALFLSIRMIHRSPLTAGEVAANEMIDAAMAGGRQVARVQKAYDWVDEGVSRGYRRLVSTRWFAPILSLLFVVAAIVQIATIVVLAVRGPIGVSPGRQIPAMDRVASAISSLLIVVGVIRLPRSRLSAYRWFLRSTLVTILVTQVFMFVYSELAALGGLFIHVLIYVALRILISREESLAASS